MATRRLSAIMFADIVGYTAMMQRDEDHAINSRRQYRAALDEAVQRAGGETVQYYGDGALCLFPSAVGAVNCAIEIQRTLHKEPTVPVRVGIHSGDILVDAEGAYGDGVNLAARIQALAIPGSIYVSGKVYDEIKNQPAVSATPLGRHRLKNVQRPVEVYAILDPAISVPEEAGSSDDRRTRDADNAYVESVAVLPFDNMSSDVENEFFSDGITEEIINALTRVERLKVTSRTSSFAFKGRHIDIREIAETLGVTHVLEGSVRKAGERVRVTAQLISAADGYHLFSQTYDRELADIFRIQDEIAAKIAGELVATFKFDQPPGGESRIYTPDISAYAMYLKGRHHWNQWSPEGAFSAIELYEKAIARAPDFAPPYAGLASSYSFLAAQGRASAVESYARAGQAAEKALELDPTSVEAHVALGMVATFRDWDSTSAYEHFSNALRLGPGLAAAHYAMGLYLMLQTEYEASAEERRRALELDPLSLPIRVEYAQALMFAGHAEEGMAEFDRVLEMEPTFRSAHEGKGWANVFLKDYESALSAFHRFAELSPNPYAGAASIGFVYAALGDMDRAREQLARLEERERMESGIILHEDFAVLLSALGETEAAFDRLDRAVDEHSGGLVFVRLMPSLWEVGEHPRFRAILDRIGFWK